MSDLVGKKVKDYQVLRRLGRGAMAEVYLAQQLSLGRQVALKVLNETLAGDPTYVQRFHHEARAAAALVHGGIVQIYEVGEEGGVHFIAQEYVPGRNLGELIRGRGWLGPGLTLDILRQVSAALVKASSEGIVHRDIKPENIMLARSGEVKVADFGLARVQGDGGMNLTQVGVTMGTPLYMSPEQIEGRALDSRSDIYSLGVTAYHMLAGKPPYDGDTPLAVAVQHLNTPPEPLESRRPDVPKPVAKLVHRMLAKKPDDRFTDPTELQRELTGVIREGTKQGWTSDAENWSLADIIAVADDRAEATNKLDAVMKTSAMTAQPRTRSPWLWGGVAAVLLGVALAFLTRPRPLLAEARNGPPPLPSVWAQLYHAKKYDTEQSWLAVQEYFPTAEEYYKLLAKRGLSQYYLFTSHEYEKARQPLHDLADAGESYPALRAYGIAGLVVVEANAGHTREAQVQMSRLSNDMLDLLQRQSPDLYKLVDNARQEPRR